jgi:hypothetical protein
MLEGSARAACWMLTETRRGGAIRHAERNGEGKEMCSCGDVRHSGLR